MDIGVTLAALLHQERIEMIECNFYFTKRQEIRTYLKAKWLADGQARGASISVRNTATIFTCQKWGRDYHCLELLLLRLLFQTFNCILLPYLTLPVCQIWATTDFSSHRLNSAFPDDMWLCTSAVPGPQLLGCPTNHCSYHWPEVASCSLHRPPGLFLFISNHWLLFSLIVSPLFWLLSPSYCHLLIFLITCYDNRFFRS